jgi:coproporphyrinogen III oxidase-like Fe-S oxidoreductase
LVRSTAEAAITLSLLNRERLEKMLAKVQENFRATELIDITADGIKRQLEKLFTSQDLGV